MEKHICFLIKKSHYKKIANSFLLFQAVCKKVCICFQSSLPPFFKRKISPLCSLLCGEKANQVNFQRKFCDFFGYQESQIRLFKESICFENSFTTFQCILKIFYLRFFKINFELYFFGFLVN
jgi:hypothetical protein